MKHLIKIIDCANKDWWYVPLIGEIVTTAAIDSPYQVKVKRDDLTIEQFEKLDDRVQGLFQNSEEDEGGYVETIDFIFVYPDKSLMEIVHELESQLR